MNVIDHMSIARLPIGIERFLWRKRGAPTISRMAAGANAAWEPRLARSSRLARSTTKKKCTSRNFCL